MPAQPESPPVVPQYTSTETSKSTWLLWIFVVLGCIILGVFRIWTASFERTQVEAAATAAELAFLDNFPVKIEALRITCLDYFEGEQRNILEGRLASNNDINAVCIVYSVKNNSSGKGSFTPLTDGMNTNYYNFITDQGANFPCGYRTYHYFDANVNETYVCFEDEGAAVESVCIEVRLNDTEGVEHVKTICGQT